jgi:enamine deaminase RidA (YjgF/YER057c/UK114 family)
MSLIIERIKELGYELPEVPEPIANYESVLRDGNMIFTSGMLPVKNGKLLFSGEVGGYFNSVEYGYEAAKLCILNALSVINKIISLDNIEKVVKVTGFINSASGFTNQPKILNGASDLLVEIFGEKGRHVRSAVGVSELPLNASVEIEMMVKVN